MKRRERELLHQKHLIRVLLSEIDRPTAHGQDRELKLFYRYLADPGISQRQRVGGLTVIMIFGRFPSDAITRRRATVSSFPTISLIKVGRYFSTHGRSPPGLVELNDQMDGT